MFRPDTHNQQVTGRSVELKWHIAAAGLTVFGALLRLYHLGYKSLWYDEAVMYWISRGDIREILTRNAANNSAPPFYAFLINLISGIGESESILRSASWIAGVVAIPAIYFLARQFISGRSACFTTMLVAIAPSQIRYSQQLREYSLAFALAVILLALFYCCLRKPGYLQWILFALFAALSVLLQYGLSLLLLGLNIVFLIELLSNRQVRPSLVKWIAAQLPALGAVAAVWYLSLEQQLAQGAFGATVHLAAAYWDGTVASFVRLAVENTYALFKFAFPAESLILFFAMLGVFWGLVNRNYRLALMMFFIPLFCTFAAALLRLYPYNGYRQDIFLTPMTYLVVGLSFEYLSSLDTTKFRIVAIAAGIVFGLIGLRTTVSYLLNPGDENLRPIVAELSASFSEGDRILVYEQAIPAFEYYVRDNGELLSQASMIGPGPELQLQLDDILTQPGRIWMVFTRCDLAWESENACEVLMQWAARLRNLEPILAESGAWLYLMR